MTEHLKADLLRRRREELGLQAAPAAPSQQLLRLGVLLGAAPLALVLLLGLFFQETLDLSPRVAVKVI